MPEMTQEQSHIQLVQSPVFNSPSIFSALRTRGSISWSQSISLWDLTHICTSSPAHVPQFSPESSSSFTFCNTPCSESPHALSPPCSSHDNLGLQFFADSLSLPPCLDAYSLMFFTNAEFFHTASTLCVTLDAEGLLQVQIWLVLYRFTD